jgi:hypothetical protein
MTATSKRRDKRKTQAQLEPKQVREDVQRQADYERRLRIAGIHDDDPPDNDEDVRRALARRIWIFINDWHGCRLRLCRRNRGCMAPHNRCANQVETPSTPEEDAAIMAKVSRAVKAEIARRDAEEGEEERSSP